MTYDNIIIYSDIAKSNDKSLYNYKSVLDAVENVLYTRVGERPHNRLFGSKIEDYLFDLCTELNARFILSNIIYSLSVWEKRVTVLPESEVIADCENRRYIINLYLKIKGLEDIVNYSKDLYLKTKK